MFVLKHYFLKSDSYLHLEIKAFIKLCAWCYKRRQFRCKVLERDFHFTWKGPTWTPLCLSQPYTRPCAYQFAQAAENGGHQGQHLRKSSTSRSCSWGLLQVSCRRDREAVLNGGVHHYWANGFEEGWPCGKWITRVARDQRRALKPNKDSCDIII